jgi:signal transduction histidine kinase
LSCFRWWPLVGPCHVFRRERRLWLDQEQRPVVVDLARPASNLGMPNRNRTFREIFRAREPLASESFRRLALQVTAGTDPWPLEEFFLGLNRELVETPASGDGEDSRRVREVFLGLLDANAPVALAALESLLKGLQLRYHDPLVAVVFEAASEVRPLLSLLAGLMEMESHFLEFRARAVEAFVMRSPGGRESGGVELETQYTLQLLNAALDDLGKGTIGDFADWYGRWSDGLKTISRLFPGGEEPSSLDTWRRAAAESQRARSPAHEMLAVVAEALRALAFESTARSIRVVLRILRANGPLPPWHGAPPPGADASGERAEPSRKILALVVDKTVQIVLGMASARWGSEVGRPRGPKPRDLELSPFNQRVLEAALLDPGQVPRTRGEAAGLLHILARSMPAARLPARVCVYSELFLRSYQAESGATASRRLASVDSPEALDVLLDAVDDTCQWIRHAACEACWSIARAHPAWFQPRHYTRLLPFLSDDDRGIRGSVMQTFQTLAGYRSQQVATVIHSVSTRFQGDPEEDDEHQHAHRDLETALGITLDRLVGDIEQLQREVQALEARRRELLDHIEKQAVRVGEEIHHEVLGALGGYLATALDEADYPEAKRRLDDLVAELRRIMNNLYPADLETEGFLQTIRNRLRAARAQMERRTPGCRVDLDCPPEITDDVIAQHVGGRAHLVLLYRITLEAITNARKHSWGSWIGVQVRAVGSGNIDVSVVDDGRGNGGPFRENVGMALMRQRAEEIGASIRHSASPQGGTAVIVRLARPQPTHAQVDDPDPGARDARPPPVAR